MTESISRGDSRKTWAWPNACCQAVGISLVQSLAPRQEWGRLSLLPARPSAWRVPGEIPSSSQPCIRAGEWVGRSQRLQRQLSRVWNTFLPNNLFSISHSSFFCFQTHPAKEQARKCASAPSPAHIPPFGNFCFQYQGMGPFDIPRVLQPPHLCMCCFSSLLCHTLAPGSVPILLIISQSSSIEPSLEAASLNTNPALSQDLGPSLEFLPPLVI